MSTAPPRDVDHMPHNDSTELKEQYTPGGNIKHKHTVETMVCRNCHRHSQYKQTKVISGQHPPCSSCTGPIGPSQDDVDNLLSAKNNNKQSWHTSIKSEVIINKMYTINCRVR